MKIGYPCINNSLDCTTNSTFRLSSYSEGLLKEKIRNNLNCLERILEYNLENGLLFFRISSDLIPFASHPICQFDWKSYFAKDFKKLGSFCKQHDMRISMHPDQFVLINAIKEEIVEKSIKELIYHCDVLDLMELDPSAKIQIHIGGVYKDKNESIKRFIQRYHQLPDKIKKRLCIENDDHSYSISDCFSIHQHTKIPIIFDNFHHECYSQKESLKSSLIIAASTWQKEDGILMGDYSSQAIGERRKKHTKTIDINHFKKYFDVIKSASIDMDLMLEIKDKEKSALQALALIQEQKFYEKKSDR